MIAGPWFAREYASPEGRWYVRNADGVSVVAGPSLKDADTAYLIAAAPEMYEALKAIAEETRRRQLPVTSAVNDLAVAAIAKAEGKQ